MSANASPPTAEQALALEIIDALSVIAPRRWQRIELQLTRGAHGRVRVGEVSTHVSSEPPLAQPKLGLEPGALHGAINEALHDLCELLDRAADLPSRVEVVRGEDGSFRVRVDGDAAHGEHVVELAGPQADLLIFTEALFDAMLAVDHDFEPHQRALSKEIEGHDDWSYDAETLTLTLKRGVLPWRTLHAIPVGSFVYETESWLWAWANRSLPDGAVAAAKAARATAVGVRGLSALRRPDLPCTEAFAVRLAAIAAMRMGARGIYGAPFGPGVMLLAVTADPAA